jgi:hypothetical protein
MEWLKDHVFLATWFSLLVTTTGLVIRNVRAKTAEVDWVQTILCIVCLSSLAVAFTPSFDAQARGHAEFLGTFSLLALIYRGNKH